MEISLADVAKAWSAFSEIANRPGPPPGQIQIFHAYLASKLSLEEFAAACKIWTLKSTFLPAPSQLLELVIPSAKENALEDWTRVLSAASNCAEGVEGLSPSGQKALFLVGGLYVVSQNPSMVRSAFLDFHETFQSKAERLATIELLGGKTNTKALPEEPLDRNMLFREVGAELGRTNTSAFLPAEVQQSTGKKTVSELNSEDLREYLEKLKSLPTAEVPRYAI